MTVTIELSGPQELEQLKQLLESLNISSVNLKESPVERPIPISRGDKTLDPTAIFGLWKDDPRTIEEIRTIGWDRNYNSPV